MKTQYRIINVGKGLLRLQPANLHKVEQPTTLLATEETSGTVKTNSSVPNPIVYLKETVDELLKSKANYFLAIKPITGTTYNVILEDVLNELVYDGIGPMNVIIPNNATLPLPIGTIFYSVATNTGTLSVSGGVEVVFQTAVGLSGSQNEVRKYTKRGINTWGIEGGVAPTSVIVDKVSNTFFINSSIGNNSTAIVGDKTKPFLNTAGALAIIPVDDGSTFTMFYQNGGNHIMPKIPTRNLNFESYNSPASGLDTTSDPILDFSSITDLELTTEKISNTFATITFGRIVLSSGGATKNFNFKGTVIFNETVLQTGGVFFTVTDLKGVIRRLEKNTSSNTFRLLGLSTGDLIIKEIKLIGASAGTYLGRLIRETIQIKQITIHNISGTGTFSLLGSCDNITINIGNVNITGTVNLSEEGFNKSTFNFLSSLIASTAKLDVYESQGIVTGTILESSFSGLGGGYERAGAVLKFVNFSGKLKKINKYIVSAQLHFINCNITISDVLLEIFNVPSNEFVKFIGVNTFKQTTPTNLITSPPTLTIEKRGANAITTNATSLGTNVTVNNTTPNTY